MNKKFFLVISSFYSLGLYSEESSSFYSKSQTEQELSASDANTRAEKALDEARLNLERAQYSRDLREADDSEQQDRLDLIDSEMRDRRQMFEDQEGSVRGATYAGQEVDRKRLENAFMEGAEIADRRRIYREQEDAFNAIRDKAGDSYSASYINSRLPYQKSFEKPIMPADKGFLRNQLPSGTRPRNRLASFNDVETFSQTSSRDSSGRGSIGSSSAGSRSSKNFSRKKRIYSAE